MYKKILVAADASESSRHAFSTAIEYAKLFHSEIVLLHVFNHPRPIVNEHGENFTGIYTPEQISGTGNAVLDVTTKDIETCGVPVRRKIIEGYPAVKIIEEIENDSDIGLIIMGTRGHGPFTGAIIGSVAQRVLSSASCPVLVVK